MYRVVCEYERKKLGIVTNADAFKARRKEKKRKEEEEKHEVRYIYTH